MLKFVDALQSCPTTSPGDLSASVDLPSDVANWLNLHVSSSGADSTGSLRYSAAIVTASSRKVLQLQNLITGSGSFGRNIYSACQLPVISSGSKLTMHFAVSVTPSANTGFVRLFGWDAPAANAETDSAANGLVLKSDRTFRIGGSVSSYAMPIGSKVYVELDFDLVAHTVDLYANNTKILSAVSNANVKTPFAGWFVNGSSELTNTAGAIVQFSDILMLDDSGTDFNARLGPVQVDRLPLDTQTTTNFTVTGAANAIAAIDNQDLSAASYTESPITNGTPDMFTVDASGVQSTDTIYGLVIKGQSFKSTAAGLRGLNLVLDDGGTVSKQAAGILSDVPSSPGVGFVIPKDKTAAAWTDTSLAAIKVGYEATLS